MLNFSKLALRRGPRLLFDDVDFMIHAGQKVGLTGSNGSGKSSLFALILDELHADSGEFSMPAGMTIAHVAQEMPAVDKPAIEYVMDGDADLRRVQHELHKAEQLDDGMVLAEWHARLEQIGGYEARSRAARLMHGLGFPTDADERSVTAFSGGWRMRLNLAQALMCRSDLLLLDEPTNHLDLDAVIWLEDWLIGYQGTLLLISHDRDFLDRVVDHIAHVEQQHVTLYRGNYTAFEKVRAERLANQQAAYIKQQREIAHMHSYVERFRAKATKARQAQSRLKALERMELIAPAHVDSPFHFSLRQPEKLPEPLLQLDEVTAGYDDKAILSDIQLSLTPGDRIGLLGPNGAGKSTLIKLLASELSVMQGRRETAKDLRIGYFAQHQLEQLHPEQSPLEHLMQIDPGAREQELRNYLGGFGFSNEQALMHVAPFSGGEKSRLVLAMLVYQRPNLLLLDEPTNHLDLEMRQALAAALQDFDGAMVLVSHDRHLLRVSSDRLLLVYNGCIDDFSGSLDEYPRWLSDHSRLQQDIVKGGGADKLLSRKERKRIEADQRKQTQPLRNKIKSTEKELAMLEVRKSELERTLADSDVYTDKNRERLKTLLMEKAEIDEKCETLEAVWLETAELLETMQAADL
ncbi:MAG: ATP-binding cassette domain-containing protein [Gammaproteobacteria bacterium]|nr:MAG: ATP-binding cassette domain-containing protein [Gammaproteobacteria bacterium]